MNKPVTTPGQQRFLLGALATGHLVNDWVGGTIWLLAPAIAASMGLGPTEVGIILAVNGIGAGLMYIPAGLAADRLSQPGMLMLITFWWVAIGYFCATLAPGFWPVVLLLAFGVMGDAFWHPVATGVLVKRFPGRKAQVLGIHAMGGSIGAEVLGPLSTGLLLGFMDWRETLQLLTLPALLMGIAFIPMVRRIGVNTSKRISRADFRNLIRSWRNRRGLQLMGMMVFYNMSLYAMLGMMPLYLQEIHGLNALAAGTVFAVILLTGTFFQPFAGKLSDQGGRKPVILTLTGVATFFAFACSFSDTLFLFLLTLFIAVSVLTAVRPPILAAAVEYADESESTTLGIVFTMLDGVGALGALFAGLVAEANMDYAFVLAGFLGLAACLVVLSTPFHAGGGVQR